MIINIRARLAELTANELRKPKSERRVVPKQADLARALNRNPQNISQSISYMESKPNPEANMELIDKLLDLLNENGFEVCIDDFITYTYDPAGSESEDHQ